MKQTMLVMAMVITLAMSTIGVTVAAEQDFTDDLSLSFAGPAQVAPGEENEFAVRLQNLSDLPTRTGVLLEFEVTAGADLATFEWCGPTWLADPEGTAADTGTGSGYGDTIEPKEPLDPADYTCEYRGFEGWQTIDVSDDPFSTAATGGPSQLEESGYTLTRLLRINSDSPGVIEGVFRAVNGDGELIYDSVPFNVVVGPVAPEVRDQCQDGGWETFGFGNQGECIASLMANERAGK